VKNSTLRQVVIIDDDDDICRMLTVILSRSFGKVEYALTLEAGRKLLSGTSPDVVFLDNNLPDGQGITLIQTIKNRRPDTVVILITAMDNSREAALKSGADIFLEKPLTYDSILNALKKITTQTGHENIV